MIPIRERSRWSKGYQALCLLILLSAVSSLTSCAKGDREAPSKDEAALSSMRENEANYAPSMKACLKEKGFEVSILPDGGIESKVAPEQQEAFLSARQECLDELGYGGPPPSLDPGVLILIYEERIATRECLADEGYSMAEPPTQETFVDSGGAWDPFEDVPPGSQDAARAACPSK